MAQVSSEEVARYQQNCSLWAEKYVGWNQAEHDDLVQEGMIAVWQSLAADVPPSRQVVTGRMVNWVRALGRQLGVGIGETHVPLVEGQGLDQVAYDDWLADEFVE